MVEVSDELVEALRMISVEAKTSNEPIGRSVFKALATCGEIADAALAALSSHARGEMEPVCTVAEIGAGGYKWLAPYPIDALASVPVGTPLYTTPPARAVAEQAAVKALEWESAARWRMAGELIVATAQTSFGYYSIIKGTQGRFSVYFNSAPWTGSFTDEDEAKAAAQADYEQRIRSALISPPSDRIEALEAENARLREALVNLEHKATAVANKGAIPGHHFSLLNGALILARTALSKEGR